MIPYNIPTLIMSVISSQNSIERMQHLILSGSLFWIWFDHAYYILFLEPINRMIYSYILIRIYRGPIVYSEYIRIIKCYLFVIQIEQYCIIRAIIFSIYMCKIKLYQIYLYTEYIWIWWFDRFMTSNNRYSDTSTSKDRICNRNIRWIWSAEHQLIIL